MIDVQEVIERDATTQGSVPNIPMRKDYQDPKYIQGSSEIRED
jgi:hypothetical protein